MPQQFSFKMIWLTAGFKVPFFTATLGGPEAAKRPRTIIPPPPCFAVLFLKCGVSSHSRCNTTHTLSRVRLWSHQSTECFPRSLGDHHDVLLKNWVEPYCSVNKVLFKSGLPKWRRPNSLYLTGTWLLELFRCCCGVYCDFLNEFKNFTLCLAALSLTDLFKLVWCSETPTCDKHAQNRKLGRRQTLFHTLQDKVEVDLCDQKYKPCCTSCWLIRCD